MTRCPTRAIFSLTPAPIAATIPHGSCPAMTGLGLTGSPPIAAPPDFGRRYWCRSLPHMPEAFISTTTSPGPGAGSGNSINSSCRSPVNTTPRIASSAFPYCQTVPPNLRSFTVPRYCSEAMPKLLLLCLAALLGWLPAPAAAADAPTSPSNLPRYDHIVIVVEENKDYDQIISSPAAPYLNKLAMEGANFTRMFAEEHNSQGNYFWLFSGSNQGLGFHNQIPRSKFNTSNLGEQLIIKGLPFKGYAQ